MIKVVYFDDMSATDYLNIYDGGNKIKTSEQIKDKSTELASKTTAGLYAKLSWLPFIGGKAGTEANADFSYDASSLLKTTLSNTVLTDFLDKAKGDAERILHFSGYGIKAYKNSMAYFKMFTPYLTMAKTEVGSDGFTFDISRIDEAFESGKGYYELLAEKDGKPTLIFRFNIAAFRNNYGIADLSKMQLSFYGVKVGKSNITLLDINQEFNLEKNTILSAYDIENQKKDENELDVYDVILAGVE